MVKIPPGDKVGWPLTQLYESYGLDTNTYVEIQVGPPESPNGEDVQSGSESTNVQTFVPIDRVLNLTEDVLPHIRITIPRCRQVLWPEKI